MVNNAIYSYKLFDEYWKPLNQSFYNVARLSLRFAKMHYKTILYCDDQTKEAFDKEGLVFDEYRIRNEWFVDVNRATSGKPKIYAAADQTEPYVLLDLDTLIFSKLFSNNCITYGFGEANNTEDYDADYVETNYKVPFEKMKDRIDIKLKWGIYPNNSVVLVNNPTIMRMACEKVIDIMQGNFSLTTAMFYEQFLLYNYLVHYQTPIGFFYKSPPVYLENEKMNYLNVLSKQFAHLGEYKRPREQEVIKRLQDFLDKKSKL